ncbi:MAG: hypothetical protein MR372_01940 [Lachnospiraceae bacterium]|nr:hypothetical protein [Lachnospiraceae bacterium]MDY6221381.1 hypothetical protein [Candidatus Alectryocaccobium sp.]
MRPKRQPARRRNGGCKCSVCKAEIEKKIDKTGRTEGDWEITEEAKWKMCRELVLKSAQYVVR